MEIRKMFLDNGGESIIAYIENDELILEIRESDGQVTASNLKVMKFNKIDADEFIKELYRLKKKLKT